MSVKTPDEVITVFCTEQFWEEKTSSNVSMKDRQSRKFKGIPSMRRTRPFVLLEPNRRLKRLHGKNFSGFRPILASPEKLLFGLL